MNILDFLKELKYASPDIPEIFLQGSCFRLFKILETIYPEALAWYSDKEGHWITEIDGAWYDINGMISDTHVELAEYERRVDMEASAYIPTHNGQSVDYNKYEKSV